MVELASSWPWPLAQPDEHGHADVDGGKDQQGCVARVGGPVDREGLATRGAIIGKVPLGLGSVMCSRANTVPWGTLRSNGGVSARNPPVEGRGSASAQGCRQRRTASVRFYLDDVDPMPVDRPWMRLHPRQFLAHPLLCSMLAASSAAGADTCSAPMPTQDMVSRAGRSCPGLASWPSTRYDVVRFSTQALPPST